MQYMAGKGLEAIGDRWPNRPIQGSGICVGLQKTGAAIMERWGIPRFWG
jgi:hypothetical protein